MFEALIVTLREGVEAALVIGIALAFLRRRGLDRLVPALFSGAAFALLASIGVAWLATRVTWNEELAEGIVMLVGAVLVLTLVYWMWRAAPRMREEIETGMERSGGSTLGVFLFAFGMVFREGVETAIFLSAAGLDRGGLGMWVGALIGLGLALAFGVLFERGSLRVPLRPFFTITSAVLVLLALQLLVGGLHELSEAQVLPASKREMALIGPIVKNELLLFTLTIGLAAGWLLLRARPGPPGVEGSGPEARLARAERQRELSWRRASVIVGPLVVVLLTTAFVQRASTPAQPPATALAPSGDAVSIDPAVLADGRAHFYEVALPERPVRLFAVLVDGEVRTCADACEICGDFGYYEDGADMVCRNCTSPIARSSLGKKGGCNPIALTHRATGGPEPRVEIALSELRRVVPYLGGR